MLFRVFFFFISQETCIKKSQCKISIIITIGIHRRIFMDSCPKFNHYSPHIWEVCFCKYFFTLFSYIFTNNFKDKRKHLHYEFHHYFVSFCFALLFRVLRSLPTSHLGLKVTSIRLTYIVQNTVSMTTAETFSMRLSNLLSKHLQRAFGIPNALSTVTLALQTLREKPYFPGPGIS